MPRACPGRWCRTPTLRSPMQRQCDSSIKVFSILDQTVTDVINLGGCFRSDELDWDPVDQVVLIANPAEQPTGKTVAPFISLISSKPVAPGKHHPS